MRRQFTEPSSQQPSTFNSAARVLDFLQFGFGFHPPSISFLLGLRYLTGAEVVIESTKSAIRNLIGVQLS